jgi:hypothetical protein
MTNTTDFITSVYDELRRQLNVGNDNLGDSASEFMLMAWPGYALNPSDFKPASAPSGPYDADVAKETVSQLANIAPLFSPARFENSGFQIDDLYEILLSSAIPRGAKLATVATDPTFRLFSNAMFEFEQARRGIKGDPNAFYYPCTATPARWYDETLTQGWTGIVLKQKEAKPATTASPFLQAGGARLAESEVWRLSPTAAQAPKVMLDAARLGALRAAPANPAPTRLAPAPLRTVDRAVVAPRMTAVNAGALQSEVASQFATRPAVPSAFQARAVATAPSRTTAGVAGAAGAVAAAYPRELFLQPALPKRAAPDVQRADFSKANLGVLNLKHRLLLRSALDRALPAKPSSPATDGFQISFQFCRVSLDRPWLKLALLKTRNWWMFGTPAGEYSTGRADANPGMFPLLPTSFIAIRNLRITANWSPDDKQSMNRAASFGFFDLRGAAVSSNSITMPGMQLIGTVCTLMPLLPPLPPQP